MNRLRDLAKCIVIILPIWLIEWREFDKLSGYILFWTVFYLYSSLQFHKNYSYSNIPFRYAEVIAVSMQCAYLFAAVDVRFIHVSDDVDMLSRSIAASIYTFMIIFQASVMEIRSNAYAKLGSTESKRIINSTVSLIYFTNAIILASGQVALDSKVSSLLILPGVLWSLLWSVEIQIKRAGK